MSKSRTAQNSQFCPGEPGVGAAFDEVAETPGIGGNPFDGSLLRSGTLARPIRPRSRAGFAALRKPGGPPKDSWREKGLPEQFNVVRYISGEEIFVKSEDTGKPIQGNTLGYGT